MQRLIERSAPKEYKQFYIQYDKMIGLIHQLMEKKNQNTQNKLSAIEKTRTLHNTVDTTLPEIEFRKSLSHELVRINSFAVQKARDIEHDLRSIVQQLNEYKKSTLLDVDITPFADDIQTQADEIVHLDSYVRIHYQALVALCTQFDTLMNITSLSWIMSNFIKEPFCTIDQDKLLLALDITWITYREMQKAIATASVPKTQSEEATKVWVPPESFERETTKYWVKQENVVRCKTEILKHMPYLIFGKSFEEIQSDFLEGNDNDVSIPEEGKEPTGPSESQLVSSVYLDNLSTSCYIDRIDRREGAYLIRLRWYGDNNGEGDKEIFVEKKTHHEKWTGLKSIKERFPIKQKYVNDFLKGNYSKILEEWKRSEGDNAPSSPEKSESMSPTLEEKKKEKKGDAIQKKKEGEEKKESKEEKERNRRIALLKDVSHLIQSKNLVPMVRTSYMRSAYQETDNNVCRFSLDVNLCMVNELRSSGKAEDREERKYDEKRRNMGEEKKGDERRGEDRRGEDREDRDKGHLAWCRTANDVLIKNDLVRFPFAVLEVKLQGDSPLWVNKMLCESAATDIYKFSKFQHGLSFLHQNLIVSNRTKFPHWFQEFQMKGYGLGFGVEDNMEGGERRGEIGDMGEDTRGELQDLELGEVREKRNYPKLQRVEPKSFFAAERNFLHYVVNILYLLTLSILSLFHQKSTWNFSFMVLLSIFILIKILYTYSAYLARIFAIKNYSPSSKFDHPYLPSLFTFLVLFLFVLIFIHSFFYPNYPAASLTSLSSESSKK